MPSDERNLAAAVQSQLDDLAARRSQPSARHELLHVLRERRRPGPPPQAPPAGTAGDDVSGVPQFDYLPAEVGWDTLVVTGELLITRDSFRRARSSLAHMKQEPVGCDHLRGEILKLTHREGRSHLTAPELAHLARKLRQQGLSAALAHMTVTGPVGKGQGGPQPVQARKLPRAGGPKRPRVAVIDTGISPQRHSSVAASSETDELHQFPLGDTAKAQRERRDYLSFDAGHGTFVTGIIQQLAPDAEITVYRAMDSDGLGSEVDVACAMIRAVTEDENQIINLSLGGQTHDDIPPIAIQRALDVIGTWGRKHDREVIVVAAAGNYGDTRPCWPAAFPGVVSVAGLTPGMLPAPWSSRGFWVTCSTVGQGLASTFVRGRESPVVAPARPAFRGRPPWAAWSGTSFAAPQIAGQLAAGYRPGGDSLRRALDKILSAGTPIPGFGQAVKILPGG